MATLRRFEAFLQRRGLKQTTIQKHIQNVFIITRALHKYGVVEVEVTKNYSEEDINKHATEMFKSTSLEKLFYELKLDGRKSTYINSLIATIRVYGAFLKEDEAVLSHMVKTAVVPGMLKYKFFKEGEYIKATMSDEEIDKFLKLPCDTYERVHHLTGKMTTYQCDPRGHKRYTMFWHICAYTGARMGEVAKLTVDDIDFSLDTILFRDTKTNDNRTVPIPPNIRERLYNYVNDLKGNKLFPARRGGRDGVMNNVDWHYNFKKRIERLGIKRENLTPYSLRHSFISTILDNFETAGSLFATQRLVGHKEAKTTAHYYHHSLKSLRKAQESHPNIMKGTDPETIINNIANMLKQFKFEDDERFQYELDRKNGELKFKISLHSKDY